MREESPGFVGRNERLLAGILIASGAALRVAQYLVNRSLRIDEAALASSIVQRSYAALSQFLDFWQVAPVGFLWVEKAVTSVLGSSEYALRLPPLIAGLASLFVFRALSRRVLPPVAALFALAIFSFSRWLVFYASDLKQYSTDVLVSAWILLAAIRMLDEAPDRRRTVRLAVAGLVAGFFSYAAFLVSAGIAAPAAIGFLVRRERRVATIAGLSGLWTIGSAASVAWSLRKTDPGTRVILHDYWVDHAGLPALDRGAIAVLRWAASSVRKTFDALPDAAFLQGRAGWALGIGLALAAIAGLIWLWRSRPLVAAFLIFPLFVALGSAIAQRYPFSGRLVLFLYPSLLTLIGAGFAWIVSARSAAIRAVSVAGAVGLAGIFGARSLSVFPEHFEELRPVLEKVSAHPGEGPVAYWVYSSAEKGLRYYSTRMTLPPGDVRYVCRTPDFWPAYIPRIADMAPGRRVWVVLSHLDPEEAEFLWRCFDVYGTPVAAYSDTGAFARLYLLAPPDPARVEALERSIPDSRRQKTADCDEDSLRQGSRPIARAAPGR